MKLRRMSGLSVKSRFDAVEIRIVEAEAVRPGDEQRPVARDDDAAFDAVGEILDVLEPQVVGAETRPRHPLRAEVHRPALGERPRPHALVEELDRPRAGRLALRRREVGEVERSIPREVRVEDDVVQPLRADGLDAGHAGDGAQHHAIRPHHAHRPDVLRDEEVAVGQEGDGPRAGQAGGDGLNVDWRRRFGGRRRFRLS